MITTFFAEFCTFIFNKFILGLLFSTYIREYHDLEQLQQCGCLGSGPTVLNADYEVR